MDSSRVEDIDEQLRCWQNDEFKALKVCFADQLVDLRKLSKVSKNPKKRKREKLWIPIELSVKIESHPEPIAQFDLHIKCSRKYPLVPPAIGFRNIKGISMRLITKLHKQLKLEAASEEHKGQGCISLLIMSAQQFLEDHYRDLELNNKSFYDQMVEQRQTNDREVELSRKFQDEMDKLERDRQAEEIRQKIIRKRELYNERKTRRDSQNSNVENEVEDSIYDFDGDLDADATTASSTDDGDTLARLKDLEEESEEEDTTIVNRRNFISKDQSSKEVKSFDDHGSLTRENSIQSRVDLEYEVLEELGHGGFGTVYKVKNRVDSQLYALKKVKLNPDNEALNERIMREVKLLSGLNHENVIRYYTAWNETETYEVTENKRRTRSQNDDDSANFNSKNIRGKSCILGDQRELSESSDDEPDDIYHTSYLINDQNLRLGENSASYVVFDTNDDKDENEIVESMKKALGPNLSDDDDSDMEQADNAEPINPNKTLKVNRWLYIQMELGQGTLREAIDGGLPLDKDRARRFFREILDGLCHIHRRKIIHRDLKPVNIFLDSTDRPKIGDFGLATTNLFIVTQNNSPGIHTATAIKPNRMSLERLRLLATPELGETTKLTTGGNSSRSGERLKYIQYNQTDNIGTPLYMSPELSATNTTTRIAKVVYSHKVDVYSLGIIYFEMLYPFATGHERIITLQDLRKKTIDMPVDVDTHLSRGDIELIKLLLTHDVSARPTSEKLLSSNLVPSLGLKEREMQNVIMQVVQNSQAHTHKLMLRLLFEQNDSYGDDYVFDIEDDDYPKQSNPTTPTKTEAQQLLKDFTTKTIVLDQVKLRLELLLKSRGFIQYSTPTLMPKYSASKYYSRSQIDDVAMLMDKNSSILTLPYDLRLPFARNIVRKNINYMNRYSIEKIFRQRQMFTDKLYHPDQLWECCLDIVTPPLPQGLRLQSSDAEILNLMGEVIRSLPMLYNLQPSIKLNDIRLVKALIGLTLSLGNKQHSITSATPVGGDSSDLKPIAATILASQAELIDSILGCVSESLNSSLKKPPSTGSGGSQSSSHNSYNQSQNSSQSSSYQFNHQTTNSLPVHVKEDLKRDLVANKLLSHTSYTAILISFLDVTATNPNDLINQYEQLVSRYNSWPANSQQSRIVDAILNEIRQLILIIDHLVCYSTGLGLDLPYRISAGFVLNALRPVTFYSGMVCLLECLRYSKIKLGKSRSQHKSVILAVGGRYDCLIDQFSEQNCRHRPNSLNSDGRDHKPKTAVGLSFEVEKLARFVLEDYVEKYVTNRDQPITTPTIQQLVKLNSSLGSTPANIATNIVNSSSANRWPWTQNLGQQNVFGSTPTHVSLQSPIYLQAPYTNLDTSTSSQISQQQHQQFHQLAQNANNISGNSYSNNNFSPAGLSGNLSSSQGSSSFSTSALINSSSSITYQQHNQNNNHHHLPQQQQYSSISTALTNALCVRYWPIDLAICTLAHPKSKPQITVIASLIRQLRDKGIMCNEFLPHDKTSFSIDSLASLCKENRLPYILAVKFPQQTNYHQHQELNSQQQNNANSGSNNNISTNSSISGAIGGSTAANSMITYDDSSMSSTHSSSPSASPTTIKSNTSSQQPLMPIVVNLACSLTLYQWERLGRLRPIKHHEDAQSMINFLVKRY